ncbi:MAG: DUF4286 family protein [Muribaculaceae bacterium]|nr:DUF4286 family protein [Muribaculaceae bacterium]
MIILNTTFHIHCALRNDLLTWLKEVYTPAAVESGLMSKPRTARVLGGKADDVDGCSIACQLEAESLATARRWHDSEGAKLRAEALRIFGTQKLAFFTTYLQVCE